jgi:hypothetical protein
MLNNHSSNDYKIGGPNSSCNGYKDEMIEKNGITKDELRNYADLDLGKQIRDCIVKTGSCSFEAEL